jgi:hypothetical protein
MAQRSSFRAPSVTQRTTCFLSLQNGSRRWYDKPKRIRRPYSIPPTMLTSSKITFAFAFGVAIASAAAAVLGATVLDAQEETSTVVDAQEESPPLTVLTDTFVFCGLAQCWIFNQVAYCACKVVANEPSISATLETAQGQDVSDINAEGLSQNSYLVSTFYYGDPATVAGSGDMAVYNCPKGSNGFYAQCDGALCFTSTLGTEFPFFGQLSEEEIICSCPITAAADSGLAFSTAGPFPCEEEYQRDICNDQGKTVKVGPLKGTFNNGVIIGVGAPAGTASFLSQVLKEETNGASGEIPESNQCPTSKK